MTSWEKGSWKNVLFDWDIVSNYRIWKGTLTPYGSGKWPIPKINTIRNLLKCSVKVKNF